VDSGDVVLVIHYFGFPNTTFPADAVRAQGAKIIEDASQALFLGQVFSESICSVYSPRKFMGVPDGGILVSNIALETETLQLEAPPRSWWKLALAVSQMRHEEDLTGRPSPWFPAFQEYEAGFPLGLYRCSDLSRMLVEDGIDYGEMYSKRRDNYLALLGRLEQFALFPQLPPGVVPLGFPVRVKPGLRDGVLERLYSKRIYPPVHWRIEGIAPAEYLDGHALSRTILTLICDQRYDQSDMHRQACEFEEALFLAGASPQ
jgi:dTDP-4-amino-4,6-dideoxygalactose transaminase